MSEARHQRFEIDIEEIERELRRSVEAAPAARPDPLAELARIVGQDDPFRGILGSGRPDSDASDNVHPFPRQEPVHSAFEPVLTAEDRSVLDDGRRSAPAAQEEVYDPVAEAYGSPDGAYDQADMQSLRPRRSRKRLAAVTVMLLGTAGAIAGGLYWQRSGGSLGVAGAPPLITADKTPVKMPPDNPGGMEVPNQDRQIYERGAQDGQSRVVDGREQPVDVREVARTLPAPGVSARAPVPSADTPAANGAAAPAPAGNGGAVVSALGEPRRVRTVAVRPDGSVYTPTTSSPEAPPSLLPGNTPPPPVQVATVSVPSRPSSGSLPASPMAPSAPASTAAPESSGAVPRADEGAPAPGAVAVKVLPPARPKFAASGEAASRTASVQPGAAPARDAEKPKPAAEKPAEKPAADKGKFTVQIAVRPTEDEARTAYTQLQDKYAGDLDGRPARVTKGEVNGKTVHRVRVGPMNKGEAEALCSKLKSSGGSCFVAGN